MTSKRRFDCLIEKSEKSEKSEKCENNEQNTFKKNVFKKESEGRFNFSDSMNDSERKRNHFGRDRNRDYDRRERNLNNFDRTRGATYGRRPGINYERRYNDRDSYNSFNRKRRDYVEDKKAPKQEFKITEDDFPALG